MRQELFRAIELLASNHVNNVNGMFLNPIKNATGRNDQLPIRQAAKFFRN